ncbi:hypothetical protein [Roseovarius aquimarinus]|uniref:Uncharacterized protein n=1 Tax=Roseovarius aquimarinus TaxID=1229156 RepID=A0ABW7ICL7_9RHOB
MGITKKELEEIRKELKIYKPEHQEYNSKEIVYELAPIIHERLKAGAKLSALHEIVKAKLPENAKLSEATFKKYWHDAQKDLKLGSSKARLPIEDRKSLATITKEALANAASRRKETKPSVMAFEPNELWPDDPE